MGKCLVYQTIAPDSLYTSQSASNESIRAARHRQKIKVCGHNGAEIRGWRMDGASQVTLSPNLGLKLQSPRENKEGDFTSADRGCMCWIWV